MWWWWNKIWEAHGWFIITCGSVVVLLILWIYCRWNRTPGSSSINETTAWEYLLPMPKKSQTPTAFVSVGEDICKRFVEFYFQKPFSKVRPDFLINPITRNALELDCYNEELHLAVEYNGAQHYHFNRMMHNNSRDRFQNQQYRDYIKQQKCRDHGIELIIVPYTVKHDQVPSYLWSELHKRGFRPANPQKR